MQYVLSGTNDFKNPIDTILANRGISKRLFEVGEEVIEDYNKLDNIHQGVDLLLNHINKGSKIVIVVDCDFDGVSSAAIIYRYIKEVFNYNKLHYILHKSKKHGLSEDISISDDVDLIILPDASSNDYKQHKQYSDKGMDILVIDHHEAEKYSEYAVVINNQLSLCVDNKRLSGVGVVYKFLQALDEKMFESKADDYLDLVAFGNIADIMDLREEETRFLCYVGLENISNPFLKALIEVNSFQLKNKLNFNKVGWVIAPKINGTIRSGTYEENDLMFKAFISDDYQFCLEVAQMCKTAKEKQDRDVKQALSLIEPDIEMNDEDRVLIINVGNTLNYNHTGLVAGKLAEKYGVPVLLYRVKNKDKTIIGGSFRGNTNISDDLKQDLIDSELVIFAEGHPNAGGYEISIERLEELKNYLNNLYKDKTITIGSTHQVDFILGENDINLNFISTIAEYEDEWGNGIDEPLILFKDLMIAVGQEDIKGTRSKTMIINYKGVDFVKQFLTNALKDKVLDKGYITVDIVGKCSFNIYNGNKQPQVEVVDIEVKE